MFLLKVHYMSEIDWYLRRKNRPFHSDFVRYRDLGVDAEDPHCLM
jgi:hypothetical protein